MYERHAATSMVLWLAGLLLAGLLLVPCGPAAGQDDAAAASEEEVVERILELSREIDELMSRLPAARREELRKKLADPATPTTVESPPPAPVESPPPAVESPPPAPVESPPPVEQPRFRRGRALCNTLDAFDSNGDRRVNAMDRYWRHLDLWIDRNRDGAMDQREIVSTYDRKVREIAPDLDSFASDRSGIGEIRVAERVLLDLRGDGFDPESSRDDAVLLVDADALRRGKGPSLLDASGREIQGVQPFERGWRLRDEAGEVTRLSCP